MYYMANHVLYNDKNCLHFKTSFFFLKVCAEEEEVVLEANQELFRLLKNWMQNSMHMLTKLSKLSFINVTIRELLIFRDGICENYIVF